MTGAGLAWSVRPVLTLMWREEEGATVKVVTQAGGHVTRPGPLSQLNTDTGISSLQAGLTRAPQPVLLSHGACRVEPPSSSLCPSYKCNLL